jgi:hypothetical protein
MPQAKPSEVTPSASAILRWLMPLALAGLLAPALLEAGYHGAFGQSDAAGRVIGFNDSILLSHLPVMARAITPAGLINAFLPWTFAAMVLQGILTRLPFLPRRVILVHTVAFLLLQVGGLLLLFIEGHHPTGECVVEGELGPAMTLLFWSLAWVPSALAAVPWRRFIALCVLP